LTVDRIASNKNEFSNKGTKIRNCEICITFFPNFTKPYDEQD